MAGVQSRPHIAMVPTPGMGHLIPLIEFAKRLLHFNFSVTLIIPTDGPPSNAQKSAVESLPTSISTVFLPPVSFSDLPENSKIETIISLTITRSITYIRDSLKSLVETTNLVALVVDLFGTDVFDTATEFNIPSYLFFTSSAMLLSLFLYLPTLDEMVSGEFPDQPDPVTIPGCAPLHGSELLDPLQDRTNDAYKWVLHHCKRYRLARGIMANSFMNLEPGALRYLQEEEPGKPPVYPIGPIMNVDGLDKVDGSGCVKWLDNQPYGSVLFISFGSGGTLSSTQINELAYGLEMSGQRFVWVVRSPNEGKANATYFSAKSESESFDFLPKGFLERTKELGLVVLSWAPQTQILSHGSTGGFLTHCGWNSTLESVVFGVPLIAWPLFAEQKMNAVILSRDVRVALRPKMGENGIVGREEIAKVVKALMEGEDGKMARSNMKHLKDEATKLLSQDGSSTRTLSNLAEHWITQKIC